MFWRTNDAMTLDGQPLAFSREVLPPSGNIGMRVCLRVIRVVAPVYLMWGWAAWMALGLWMAHRGAMEAVGSA